MNVQCYFCAFKKMCQATAEGALLKKLAFLLKVEQFCNIYVFISLF